MAAETLEERVSELETRVKEMEELLAMQKPPNPRKSEGGERSLESMPIIPDLMRPFG